MRVWCEKNGKQIADYMPLTFALDFCSQVQDHDHQIGEMLKVLSLLEKNASLSV